MAQNEYDLVCIGSGPAGQRAAINAAKLGKKVAVIEKQRFVGGMCIDTGTIPSKTFREAVRRVYSRPGLELTDPFATRSRVRPTMPELLGHVGRVIQREIGMIHDALTRNDVAVVHGCASFVNPHTIQVDTGEGQRLLTADHFLIAVGTCPSKPAGIEIDRQTILTADEILHLNHLPAQWLSLGLVSSVLNMRRCLPRLESK